MPCSIFIGFGIGWILSSLINFVFSSKKLSKKLDKNLSDYRIEESCQRCRIQGFVYGSLGLIFEIIGWVMYFKTK